MFVVTHVREETYTFTPDDGDAPVHIRSGKLREWLLAFAMDKIIDLTFPQQTLEDIIEIHGLEEARMKSMTREEALEPVIVGLYPTGTHILIDGGHRRWYWAKRKKLILRGWAVPYDVWMEFQFNPNAPGVILHHQDGSLLPHRKGR